MLMVGSGGRVEGHERPGLMSKLWNPPFGKAVDTKEPKERLRTFGLATIEKKIKSFKTNELSHRKMGLDGGLVAV